MAYLLPFCLRTHVLLKKPYQYVSHITGASFVKTAVIVLVFSMSALGCTTLEALEPTADLISDVSKIL